MSCLVVKLIVAAEHDEAAPGHGQRVEHLLSRLPPHVRVLTKREQEHFYMTATSHRELLLYNMLQGPCFITRNWNAVLQTATQ